jgi:hypothetical protein
MVLSSLPNIWVIEQLNQLFNWQGDRFPTSVEAGKNSKGVAKLKCALLAYF